MLYVNIMLVTNGKNSIVSVASSQTFPFSSRSVNLTGSVTLLPVSFFQIDLTFQTASDSLASEVKKNMTADVKSKVNISEEANKGGVTTVKVKQFLKSLSKCKNIKIVGLMCIAKMTFDDDILIAQFSKMQKLQKEVEAMNLDYAPCHELSMGMTNDYNIALEYGATFVRLGHIFLD